jgi:hypothetical protein
MVVEVIKKNAECKRFKVKIQSWVEKEQFRKMSGFPPIRQKKA